MKTYILKYQVTNMHTFPIGTVVTITDDYYGAGRTSHNTSFTVVEGELKGKKGCVANGLQGWLIDDTPQNRKLIDDFIKKAEHIKILMRNLDSDLEEIPTSEL